MVHSESAAASDLTDRLLAHEQFSRDELLAYQRERLRSVLAHAISASPYYREALGDDPDVPLGDLPVLSKATLMEQFDRIVTTPELRLEAVDAREDQAEER